MATRLVLGYEPRTPVHVKTKSKQPRTSAFHLNPKCTYLKSEPDRVKTVPIAAAALSKRHPCQRCFPEDTPRGGKGAGR